MIDKTSETEISLYDIHIFITILFVVLLYIYTKGGEKDDTYGSNINSSTKKL